eukprot:GHRR01023864.1.p1 GENE.GHRR01023864.1~~GHRR01023864.1.p1  ORF type:complete len:108 (+),score=32.16 GHRR01023864.1:351-674(+)
MPVTAALLISKPYITAMLTGVLEYLLEATVLPSLKQMHTVSYVGIALLLLGEFVRKIAMVRPDSFAGQSPPSTKTKGSCCCCVRMCSLDLLFCGKLCCPAVSNAWTP